MLLKFSMRLATERGAIVDRLSLDPVSVPQLTDRLGITLTPVGQHLALLEECGGVRSRGDREDWSSPDLPHGFWQP